MKKVIIELEEDLHRELKIHCFTNGITLKDYITKSVVNSLKSANEENVSREEKTEL